MPGLIHQNDDDNLPIQPCPNLIEEINDYSIVNVFYFFGAFADKVLGVVYNNCTGNFLYMLLDGNIYFLLCTNTKQMQ